MNYCANADYVSYPNRIVFHVHDPISLPLLLPRFGKKQSMGIDKDSARSNNLT